MELWENYSLAIQALQKFDEQHEAKKQAIIALANNLRNGGWGVVLFEDPTNLGQAEQGAIRDSSLHFEPINESAFDYGGSIKEVVARRGALAERARQAWKELPPQFQELWALGRC